MKYSAIILAAGSGERLGLEYNKILYRIKGKRVLEYSIEYFENDEFCTEIIVVSSNTDFNLIRTEYQSRISKVIVGGSTRQESVFKALDKVNSDFILIHDAARPFINPEVIKELVHDVEDSLASTIAVPVIDTIVKSTGNRLTKTLDRTELVAIQTPQAFQTDLIKVAHIKARKLGYNATDDTELIRKYTTVMPSYVMGDYRSIKLTTKEDIPFLEVIL